MFLKRGEKHFLGENGGDGNIAEMVESFLKFSVWWIELLPNSTTISITFSKII
jgi:hypothetical protein